MLNLNKIYDFRQLICEESERTSVCDFGLLGEELDGTLLVKWNSNGSDKDAKCESLQTCIGSISPSKKKITMLYCFDSIVNVIQASLNQDHSVLAVVNFNEGFLDTKTGVVIDNTRQYKCLLIPLASQESPVTLACHSHLLHVQFRYSKKPAQVDATQDVQLIPSSQLLLSAHKETISLFNLMWEKSTESTFSYVLIYEFVETVVKAFQWAQWSLTEQCLYYVQFRPPLKLSDKEPDKPLQPMLTCLLFHDSIHYETVLNLPLDLPSLESFKTGISIHEDHPVSHKISDSRLKLGVLTRSSGVVCVCHQYVKQLDFIEQQSEFMDCCTEEFVDLCYSVTLLHHGCTMTCTIPQVPIGVASSAIEFGFYGEDYVLAVLPGQFVHLLDVGLLHGPCNHILVQDSSFDSKGFHFLNSLNVEGSPLVVSEDNCSLSLLSLSTDKLGHLLKNAQHRSTRQAIIHYLLVHLKTDPSTIFKQLQLLLKEKLHLEMPKLLQEFLIGGTYAACKRSTSKRFLSLFPITLAEPLEPQIEQGPNQNVRITYVAVPHTSMTLLSPSQRLRAAECDIWSNLWHHLDNVRCCPLKRFSSQILRDQIMVSLDYSHQMESPATTPVGLSSKSPMKKLLEYFQEPCAEVVTNRSRRSSASSENSTSSSGDDFALPFPEKDDLSCSHFAQVVSTNLREMSVHILKQFSDEQPSHVHQIATEYVANQLQTSRLLCSLLLVDLEAPAATNHPRRKKSPYFYLSRVPRHKLLPIFRFLEQYQISTMGIAYPVPQGFSTFFSVLGFTCLDYRMYMQYVSRGALQVRSEVASYIMEVLDNEPHNAKIKLDILLRLPRHKAWNILESWDHPFSHSIQAREHSRALFGNTSIVIDQQGGFEMIPSVYPQEFLSSDSGNFGFDHSMRDNFSLSLSAFMHFLEFKEIELTGEEKNHQKEMSMIWKASFPYNWTKTSCCPSNHGENGVTPFKSCINESLDTP